MAKGRFKHKPTGERSFSSPEEIAAGTSAGRPRTFTEHNEKDVYNRRVEPEEDSEDFTKPKRKGIEGLIEIENPNLVKPKNVKVKDIDIGKTTDMSRRERTGRSTPRRVHEQSGLGGGTQGVGHPAWRLGNVITSGRGARHGDQAAAPRREELDKQKSHERHMKLQEQGKTEQARKDLERLTIVRQQRAEAAKKREEEKAAKEERKAKALN